MPERVNSAGCLLVCTEAFGSDGGIQRFNRHLILALRANQRWGRQLSLVSLLDATRPALTGYVNEMHAYVGCGGDRRVLFASFIRLLARGPDILILSHPNLAPLAILARIFLPNAEVVGVLFGAESWQRVGLLRLFGLRQCHALLSISEFTRQQFCRANPIPPDKVHVLPLALDPMWSLDGNIMTPKSDGQDLPDVPYVLSVSRLDASQGSDKGLDQTIRAWGLLRSKGLARRYQYVIVGQGDDMPRLQSLARACAVGDSVIFLGRVTEERLQALYANSEAFVLPSKREGFGLVFLEAMAFARPVIAGDYGACREIVLDGTTGFLVPHDDVQRISTTLEKLIGAPELRVSMGQAGKRRLQENFTFPIFANRLVGILNEACGIHY